MARTFRSKTALLICACLVFVSLYALLSINLPVKTSEKREEDDMQEKHISGGNSDVVHYGTGILGSVNRDAGFLEIDDDASLRLRYDASLMDAVSSVEVGSRVKYSYFPDSNDPHSGFLISIDTFQQ